MLEELVQVGTELLGVSDRLQQAGEAKRQRIANYFFNIVECLEDSAEQLRNGKAPNSRWGELNVYARDLKETIGKEIGDVKAWELTCLLVRTASNTPDKKDIQGIETAAGTFRGLANTVAIKQGENSTTRRKVLTYPAIAVAGIVGGVLLHKYFFQRERSQPFSSPIESKEFPSIHNWEMFTFLSTNVQNTILWNAPQRICDRIRQMTNERFSITLNRNGETLDTLEKINNGTYKCGYSGIYYGEKYKALYFACAIPFGLNPQQQNAWLYYKQNPSDAETYVQSIYSQVGLKNIIAFPAGATGAQMGGWFKKKIGSPNDLEGLKMRIPGLGGDVLQKYFGVTLHSKLEELDQQKYPIDVCIKKLKNGEFGAVEWTGPYDDLQLRLHEAANFYYYPGWWEPGTTFDLQINRDAWKELPSHYRAIIKVACFETHMEMLAEYEKENSTALNSMPKNVELVRFDPDIYKAFEKATYDLLKSYSSDSTVFGDVYQEWNNFKKRITWSGDNNIAQIRKNR